MARTSGLPFCNTDWFNLCNFLMVLSYKDLLSKKRRKNKQKKSASATTECSRMRDQFFGAYCAVLPRRRCLMWCRHSSKHERTFEKNVWGEAWFGHETLDISPHEAAGTTEKYDALSRDWELHLVIMAFETENKHASRWTARQIEKELFPHQSSRVEPLAFDMQANDGWLAFYLVETTWNMDIKLRCALRLKVLHRFMMQILHSIYRSGAATAISLGQSWPQRKREWGRES